MASTRTPARVTSRTVRRVGLILGAGLLTSIALTGVADAHVEVTPESTPGGGDAEIALRVPNESDSASTVVLKVLLPKSRPVGEVQTTVTPGWTVTTSTRKLAKPITVEGEQLTSVVSQVTWRAAAGGIKPGQYQDFGLSLGGLPTSGTLVFNAVQTYSDGTVVNWNEVSADESVEPEHPAPTLTLTAPESDGAADTASDAASDSVTDAAAPADLEAAPASSSDDDGSGSVWVTLLAGAALVVSLLTALVVWRRGRPAPTEPGARSLGDTQA
jgi:periplasmic copper chaperone A